MDIAKFPVEEGDEFIILATDGLWDVMSSEEAVEVRRASRLAWVLVWSAGVFVCMYVDRRGLPWLFHWGLINHASTPPTKQTNQFVHNVMSAHVGALTEGGAGSGGDGGRGEMPGNRPGTCVCATELLVGAHPTVWPLFSTHPIHNSPTNKPTQRT